MIQWIIPAENGQSPRRAPSTLLGKDDCANWAPTWRKLRNRVFALIVVYSVLCLSLAGALGFRFPDHRIWKVIDPFYYFAGIIGVVLFFFASEGQRTLAQLEIERAAQAVELNELEAKRPEVEVGRLSGSNIRSWANLVQQVGWRGKSCRELFLYSEQCMVDRDMEPFFLLAAQALNAYESEEDLATICKTGSDIFDEMARISPVSRFIAQKASEVFHNGLIEDFQWFEFARTQKLIADAVADMNARAQENADYIAANAGDHESLSKQYGAQIQNITIMLNAFEVCLRADEEIRSGQYRSWNEMREDVSSKLTDKDVELAATRETVLSPNRTGLFQVSIWPFVLVFALSLKFGKSVSAIRAN